MICNEFMVTRVNWACRRFRKTRANEAGKIKSGNMLIMRVHRFGILICA